MARLRRRPGSEVRAAVVGAGLMGRWHAAELRRAGGRLVAVVDSEPAAASALASRHNAAHASATLQEALSATSPEVVHLCTPPSSHSRLVREALAAGVHLLVEKPLAQDAETTQELLRLAEREGLLLCPVHQYLFQRGTLRARRSIPEIAPLLHLESFACSAGGRTGAVPLLDETAADILLHPLSVLERLLPAGLDAVEWLTTRPRTGELRAVGAGGATSVSVCVSMSGRPPRNELRVIGEQGTLHLDFFHGYGLREPPRASRTQKALQPFAHSARRSGVAAANLGRRALAAEPAYPGLRELIRHLYAAVRAGVGAPIAPEESLAVARGRDRILAAVSST